METGEGGVLNHLQGK